MLKSLKEVEDADEKSSGCSFGCGCAAEYGPGWLWPRRSSTTTASSTTASSTTTADSTTTAATPRGGYPRVLCRGVGHRSLYDWPSLSGSPPGKASLAQDRRRGDEGCCAYHKNAGWAATGEKSQILRRQWCSHTSNYGMGGCPPLRAGVH